MKYRLLGHTGLRVSEIVLDTLNFGETRLWRVEKREAHRILARFADLGGTLIDTALSEELYAL